MTYSTNPLDESLRFGDTVLINVPSWAHDDGSAYTRMAVVIGDLGPIVRVALTSTSTIRQGLPEGSLRPRIQGDGPGVGNSLNHLSEVVLEEDGRIMIDKQDIVFTQDGHLKRGHLNGSDKFLIAALAHQEFPGVLSAV